MGAVELGFRELDFEATFDDATRALVLTGNADASVAKQLQSLVHAVHERSGPKPVAVDLRGLEFMAASCFNTFVVWVGLINELAFDRRYELRFVINDSVGWQRRSLATLTCFATDIVKVEQ
jgi:hypothetical protein